MIFHVNEGQRELERIFFFNIFADYFGSVER